MKKIILISFILSIVYNTVYAQPNWISLSSGTFENLKDVFFLDVNTGWVVGNAGKVLKTTNYGQTWTTSVFPMSTTNNCVFFIDANTGFIGNANGNVYKSTDGGSTWIPYPTGSSAEVTSIFFTSENSGYIGNSSGQIRYTSDCGLTWNYLYTVTGRVHKITFLDAFRGWVADNYGYIFRTTNAGANFSYTRVSTNPVYGVNFISSTIGYAVSDSEIIYKSSNGGINWILQHSSSSRPLRLNKIAVLHPDIAFAVGNNGDILYTVNGGNVWDDQTPTSNNLNGIYFVPNTNYGYCVGDLGTILRSFTSPGSGGCAGSSTIQATYPFSSYYDDARTDMLFTGNEISLAIGMSAGYIKSIAFYFASNSSQVLNGFKIKMQNTTLSALTQFTSTGWNIVFDGTYYVPGTGLRPINLQNPFFWTGGNLLIEICFNNSTFTTNSNVYSTSKPNMTFHNKVDLPTGDGCVDIVTGSVQAYRPNICFFTTIVSGEGITQNYLPDKFKLHQNYPNPFNPVTKIQYDLPNKSFVRISIFDVTGKLIETLLNETKQEGSYIIEFNASSLPSGVYFYKLETEIYSEVKKMVLIK